MTKNDSNSNVKYYKINFLGFWGFGVLGFGDDRICAGLSACASGSAAGAGGSV